MFASIKWQDWTNFALGIWLAVSPWVLGFAEQQSAMMNAVAFGVLLIVSSQLELRGTERMKEWVNMLSGLWLVIAPFALGFISNFEAAMSTALTGVLAAVFAAWALSLDKELSDWWHNHVTGH